MGIEIERKFEVIGPYKQLAQKSYKIAQGYLCSAPERTVRIRLKNNKAYITIKGKSSENGLSRFEWEKEIAFEEGIALFNLCEQGKIEKTRFEIPNQGKIIEVDEFDGDNQGLIIAEIELSDENDKFTKPEWLGKELTGDARYYNSYLSKHPFKEWGK